MNERIQKLIEQATSTQGPTPYNPLTFEVFDPCIKDIYQRTQGVHDLLMEIDEELIDEFGK